MRRSTAVGVDDNFAAGESSIAFRAAGDEAAGGIDQRAVVPCPQRDGDHGIDDLPTDRLDQVLLSNVGIVLGRHHHRLNGNRLTVSIPEGDLRFGIRTEPGQHATTAHFGLPAHQTMGEHDRRGHPLRGVVAGIPEHQPLVPGA